MKEKKRIEVFNNVYHALLHFDINYSKTDTVFKLNFSNFPYGPPLEFFNFEQFNKYFHEHHRSQDHIDFSESPSIHGGFLFHDINKIKEGCTAETWACYWHLTYSQTDFDRWWRYKTHYEEIANSLNSFNRVRFLFPKDSL